MDLFPGRRRRAEDDVTEGLSFGFRDQDENSPDTYTNKTDYSDSPDAQTDHIFGQDYTPQDPPEFSFEPEAETVQNTLKYDGAQPVQKITPDLKKNRKPEILVPRKPGRSPLGSKLLFLFFFLASTAGLVYLLTKLEIWSILAYFIQIYIGSMVFAFSQWKNRTRDMLIFIVIDACLVVAVLLLRQNFPSLFLDRVEVYGALTGLVNVLMIGLIMLLNVIIPPHRQKKRCTFAVEAECVEVKTRTVKNSQGYPVRVYCPVYEFAFYERYIRIQEREYTNATVPEEGKKYTLMINPTDPSDYYEPRGSKKLNRLIGIIGAAMILGTIALSIVIIMTPQG